jgi:hypothetical protein
MHKYRLGDSLYIIKNKYKLSKCQYCGGKGTIILKNTSFDCPACEHGLRREGDTNWVIDCKSVVKKISISITEKETKVEYFFEFENGDIPWFDEKDCFLTRNAAEAECRRRNDNCNS